MVAVLIWLDLFDGQVGSDILCTLYTLYCNVALCSFSASKRQFLNYHGALMWNYDFYLGFLLMTRDDAIVCLLQALLLQQQVVIKSVFRFAPRRQNN